MINVLRLRMSDPPYEVPWKTFWSANAMIHEFACRPGIVGVSDNIRQQRFKSRLWWPFQPPICVLVSVTLSPMVTLFYASLRFDIFSSVVTICDMAPESDINVLLSCFLFDPFSINSSSCMTSSVTLFASYF